MGGSPPDTLGSAARMVALITAHQGNDKAEYRRLDETRNEIHGLEVLPRAIEIRLGIEAELIDANEIAAENANYVGDQDQHRQGDDPREEARKHQIAQRVGGQRGERVDLIGDAHRADLRRDRGPDAASHHQPADDKAALPGYPQP